MTRRTIIGFIFIIAALLKLADMWNIFHLEWLWQRPWPQYFGIFVLLYVGVELVVYGFTHNNQWLQRAVPLGENGKRAFCSVRFGADEYIYKGEPFHGARLNAFCGGIRMDLREAVITEDEELDIQTFMGGVELLIPKNVKVEVKSNSFLGTVDNMSDKNTVGKACCLHVIARNMFGGVNIKNNE